MPINLAYIEAFLIWAMKNESALFQILCSIPPLMESSSPTISVVCCSDCHLHQQISKHSQRMYRVVFAQLQAKVFLPITKNELPHYLAPFDPPFRLFRNRLTNHIQRFPEIGSFQVFYRNVLLFSKLASEHFPNVSHLVQTIRRVRDQEKADPSLARLTKFKLEFDFEKELFHIPEGSVFENPDCFKQAHEHLKLLKQLPTVMEKVCRPKSTLKPKHKKGANHNRSSIAAGLGATENTLPSGRSLNKKSPLSDSKNYIFNRNIQKNSDQSSAHSCKKIVAAQAKHIQSKKRITSNFKAQFCGEQPNPLYLTKEQDVSASDNEGDKPGISVFHSQLQANSFSGRKKQESIEGSLDSDDSSKSIEACEIDKSGGVEFAIPQKTETTQFTIINEEDGIQIKDPIDFEVTQNQDNELIDGGCVIDNTPQIQNSSNLQKSFLADFDQIEYGDKKDQNLNQASSKLTYLVEAKIFVNCQQYQKVIYKGDGLGSRVVYAEQEIQTSRKYLATEKQLLADDSYRGIQHIQHFQCAPVEPICGQSNSPLGSQNNFELFPATQQEQPEVIAEGKMQITTQLHIENQKNNQVALAQANQLKQGNSEITQPIITVEHFLPTIPEPDREEITKQVKQQAQQFDTKNKVGPQSINQLIKQECRQQNQQSYKEQTYQKLQNKSETLKLDNLKSQSAQENHNLVVEQNQIPDSQQNPINLKSQHNVQNQCKQLNYQLNQQSYDKERNICPSVKNQSENKTECNLFEDEKQHIPELAYKSQFLCLNRPTFLFPDKISLNSRFSNLFCALQIIFNLNFELIKKLFTKKSQNQYEVKINFPIWKTYSVIDEFLFFQGKPVYCDGDLWEMILEKALALALGGYKKIKQKNLGDILIILSGMPAITSSTSKGNQTIFENSSNQNTFVFATNFQKSNQYFRVCEILTQTEQPVFKLTTVKTFSKVHESEEIMMTTKDFSKHFTKLTLLQYCPNNNVSQIPVKQGNHLLNVQCQLSCKCFVSITIEDIKIKSEFSKTRISIKCQNEGLGSIARKGNFFFQVDLSAEKPYLFRILTKTDLHVSFSCFPGKVYVKEQSTLKQRRKFRTKEIDNDGDDEGQ